MKKEYIVIGAVALIALALWLGKCGKISTGSDGGLVTEIIRELITHDTLYLDRTVHVHHYHRDTFRTTVFEQMEVSEGAGGRIDTVWRPIATTDAVLDTVPEKHYRGEVSSDSCHYKYQLGIRTDPTYLNITSDCHLQSVATVKCPAPAKLRLGAVVGYDTRQMMTYGVIGSYKSLVGGVELGENYLSVRIGGTIKIK